MNQVFICTNNTFTLSEINECNSNNNNDNNNRNYNERREMSEEVGCGCRRGKSGDVQPNENNPREISSYRAFDMH